MITPKVREYISFKRSLYEQREVERETESSRQDKLILDVPEESESISVADAERNIERMIRHW